jgi:hypothetical protein
MRPLPKAIDVEKKKKKKKKKRKGPQNQDDRTIGSA